MESFTSPSGSSYSPHFTACVSSGLQVNRLLQLPARRGCWNVSRFIKQRRSHTTRALRCLTVFFLIANCWVLAFGQAKDQALAIVNGRSITQREVENLVMAQTLPLEEKLYAIRKAALENLITSRVLEGEAERRGIPVAELRKELASGDVRVTPGEVEAAYAENASFFASMSPDEAKERLRLDLENQGRMQNYRAALERLRRAARIDLLLTELRIPLASVSPSAPSLGPVDAAITVVEYSDFECPYCREVQPAIKKLLNAYGRQLRVVFKHLPLQIHQQAFPAAQAAFCAGQQGRFWQYHDALFSTTSLTPEFLNQTAANLNLDLSAFKTCLSSAAAQTAVRSDMREATQLGINSAPVFIINGKLVRGAISFEEFKAIVERELKTAQNSSQVRQPQPARKE